MATENKDSFFSQYGKLISAPKIKKNSAIPFKDNTQFSVLTDILSRKDTHHVIVNADFSHHLYQYFLEALLAHLNQENTPNHLRGTDIIHLDIPNLHFIKNNHKNIENAFLAMLDILNSTEKYMLFSLAHFDLFSTNNNQHDDEAFLRTQFNVLLAHPKARFIFIGDNKKQKINYTSDSGFSLVNIPEPNEDDIMIILKFQRTELENFHHILIPEELLTHAYSLAKRFLSTNFAFEKTLLLLDSSAARTAAIERADINNASKPVMSAITINNVVSTWTQLPPVILQMHKFKYGEFVNGMMQKIYGQDAAITLLAHELQQSQSHLQQHNSPFCSLLFAGSEHSGKKTTAIALAEQLFKQTHALYFVQSPSQSIHSILDIKLQCHFDNQYITLKELVQQTPYAMIMYENIDCAPAFILDQLNEILSTGFLYDASGIQYNFRQMIIILSTTLGSELMFEIAKTFTPEPESSDMDLFQLVMHEQKHTAYSKHHYSPQEIADEISAYITKLLPASLCQHLHVLPFFPLNKPAIEKIIQFKLKTLSKTLESRYGVQFGYAQEIIRQLAGNVLQQEGFENKHNDIDKALKQLYFVVEQAILGQIDNKNRSNQLFIQLNETGQVLKCDWLGSVDMVS